MARICWNRQNLCRHLTCRWWMAVAFAGMLGVTIGRNALTPVLVVEGTSMLPNYPPGARLSTVPVPNVLLRGDVVLIDDGSADYAVKRVIGLPGETVQIWRGQVFINGHMLVEPYLCKHTFTYPIERKNLGAAFVVGKGEYFVLGDNRLESADSRTYGPLAQERIKRLIPLPEGFTRAHFAHYTLPAAGKSLIQPL